MIGKITITTLLFSLLIYTSGAQINLYEYVKPGKYTIGYTDSIVFDTIFRYESFDYAGMKPHFIQIWYPLKMRAKQSKPLQFRDFYTVFGNKISGIQSQLKKHYQEDLIRDCIEQNCANGEANDFGPFSYEEILSLIGEIKTRSIAHKISDSSNFPVIVYHHGSQSFPFENFLMAEFFASRGYVFVASNFHLPYENSIFGLKPFDKIIQLEEEESLKSVLQFARSLSRSKQVFFIGHSWGAQMGFRTFHNDSSIRAFVSMESTIEFTDDHEKIKDRWPEVFQKINTENARYPYPIMLCAATGQEKVFPFFEKINCPRALFVSTIEDFNHNAYVSAFYLRLGLSRKIKQADKKNLLGKLKIYNQHLELIDQFLQDAGRGENKPKTEVVFMKGK